MNVSVTHIPDSAPHGGLYAVLSALHIPYEEISHAPVRTVAEAQAIKTRIAGTGCKNLLLTDARQEVFVLVLLEEHKRADLKAIARALNTPRLRFAPPDALWALLRLQPGSVSPLGLLFDTEHRVRVAADSALRGQRVLVHPNVNTRTLAIAFDDLLRFLAFTGHPCAFL